MQSPAVTAAHGGERDKSIFVLALANVGFSDPAMLSAAVGGKLAYVSFHISITQLPTWSPVITHPVIVQL